MAKERGPLKVTVESFHDYFRWEKDLRTGEETVWVDGKKMTAAEFNKLQEDDPQQ